MIEAGGSPPQPGPAGTEDTEPPIIEEHQRNEPVHGDGGLEDFLKQRYARLLRIALRVTGTLADAEDLVQNVCLRAHAVWHRLRDADHAQCWFVRVMSNAWKDALRRRRRFGRYVLAQQLDGFAAEVGPRQESVTLFLSILTFVETLGPDQAEIWYLSEFDGATNPEIADKLKIPQGTVATRLGRARRAVQEFVQSRATVPPASGRPPGNEPPATDPGGLADSDDMADARPPKRSRGES